MNRGRIRVCTLKDGAGIYLQQRYLFTAKVNAGIYLQQSEKNRNQNQFLKKQVLLKKKILIYKLEQILKHLNKIFFFFFASQ